MIGATLLVMTDGRRECLPASIDSTMASLVGVAWERFVIHVDGDDRAFEQWVRAMWPQAEVVAPGERLGFGGAMANAWAHIAAHHGDVPWVFHQEDDFVYRRPADL